MNHDQKTENNLPVNETESLVGSVASDIRTAVSHKFDEAVTEVRGKADHAKSDVADEVKDVAMALRRASEELRGGSAQERTLGQIASSLADASDSIREKDLGEILQSVSRVARDNPALFLGGAALLGFAASRYAKASGDHANTPAARHAAAPKSQVDSFVNEGNPNTQPMSGSA
jgi:hypothetical protein